MIVEILLNLIKTVLFAVFSWISLPNFPDEFFDGVYTFIDLICNNVSLLGFFISPFLIQITVPILIILLNFDKLYHFTMWILKKIPALNIH